MNNFMNDNMAMLVVGCKQTETLPGGGFYGGQQTETLPGGGFHGAEQKNERSALSSKCVDTDEDKSPSKFDSSAGILIECAFGSDGRTVYLIRGG